jgi:type VI secretion system FHA domain protein
MTTLRLEIVGPQAAALGASAAKVFGTTGGTIGRVADNDWVLPDPYISSRHARIHWRDGQFLIEDTSSNGVFINAPDRRLGRGQMHPLQGGDRIFIDAYEIRVTLNATASQASTSSPLADLFEAKPASNSAGPLRIPDDPFGAEDPFRSAPPQQKPARQTIPEDFSLGVTDAAQGTGESIDPLELLGFQGKRPTQSVPRADDLASRSPLNDHYKPPTPVITPPPKEPAPTGSHARIPDGYDPLLDSGTAEIPDPFVRPQPVASPPPPPPPPRPTPGPRAVPPAPERPRAPIDTVALPEDRTVAMPRKTSAAPQPTPPRVAPTPPAPPTPPPAPTRNIPSSPPPATAARPPAASEGSLDFEALLKGAGLQGVQITPELAENFGRILRIVVGGLMDVLRTREQIKNEFRMRMTTFKSTDNNPLKFSANVDDALHNLLVKRNSAYLGSADAFEDAFADVRHHQMAMLAGVRVAFNAMMADFDPERLQETFDRQLKKGSLLSAPARLRYWELYRDKFHDMVKDPESNFRELFGDEFARAYEEQLESLKAVARAQRKQK